MRWHEDIVVFYKKQPTYNPQMVERLEKDKRKNKKGVIFDSPSYEGNFTVSDGMKDLKHPSSVIKVNIARGKEKTKHSTQKPIALFEWLIKTYSNEGDLVLDNCSGSGTTVISCLNTKRNYICIEKEESYYKMSVERVKTHISELNT